MAYLWSTAWLQVIHAEVFVEEKKSGTGRLWFGNDGLGDGCWTGFGMLFGMIAVGIEDGINFAAAWMCHQRGPLVAALAGRTAQPVITRHQQLML